MGIVSRSQSGGGSSAVLFDSTLGADAASIDTGAGGIAQTQSILEIFIIARTDDVSPQGAIFLTLNNDTGANYDRERVLGLNVTASAANALAQTAWTIETHGGGGSATTPGTVWITIPGYTQTTFNKVGMQVAASPDATAANDTVETCALGYRSALAISRAKVAVAGGGAVLRAGSRLLIYGR